MKKINIIVLLMISMASLLLSGCNGVGIIPEVNSGNSEYQEDTSDTETIDTGGTITEEDTETIDTGGTITTEGAGAVSDINIDKTPPEVTITLPGTGEYVLNQLVSAIWSATDDLSGVVSPVSGTISIDTSSEGTKTFTLPAGTAKDKAGNKSKKVTKFYNVIKPVIGVDTTKPVITGSRVPLPNSYGWTNTDVTVIFICADTGSIQSGIDINTIAGKTVTTEGKDQSVTNTGTCIDVAGNIADPVTVSNINIDKTPPVVTITLPDTGEYVLNQSITATWSATDALSGVVSPASGSVSINTSSVGTKTFTLPAGTAKDKAGNSSLIVTKSYSVIADTESPQKWSGLTGFVGWYSEYKDYGDIWLANGFNEFRDLRNYLDTANINASKAAVIAANAMGIKFIWGVHSGGTTITSTTWPNFRAAILSAAQWAQDNGVYEFQIGNEEELHNDNTTMTDAQLITNLKSVATEVKAIFTNGNVSYSLSLLGVEGWISAGKGDIDLLGLNAYRGSGVGTFDDWWEERIDAMVDAFGTNGIYISEFNLSSWDINNYSTDETVQAAGITEMIDYIKASGIERALFYSWHDYPGDIFGVVKDNGTYRLLWSQALLNSESVKFATVPTKTTTASLQGTIALIPRITR